MLKTSNLIGLSASHVEKGVDGVYLHPDANEAVCELREQAANAGFDLRLASGFRSFDKQCEIWNQKSRGQRLVLDDDGMELNIDDLSEMELVFAILRWSALPGASRHHWGTDFDIYDAAALKSGHKLALTVEETEASGPFFPMYQWLNSYLASNKHGFYRPYLHDRSGVAPEPWHLSYRPIASVFQSMLDVSILANCIASAEIELRDTVLAHIEEIFQRFVINVNEE